MTRVICGIRDQEVRKKLLAMSPFPNLQDAVNLCRSEESASKNEPIIRRSGNNVNKVHSKFTKNKGQHGPPQERKNRNPPNACGNCGKPSHTADQICPAKGKDCKSCGRKNHIAAVCRSGTKASNGKSEKPTEPVNRLKLGSIHAINSVASRRVPTIDIDMHNTAGKFLCTVNAVPDGGASTTVIGLKVLHHLGEDEDNLLHRNEDHLEAANCLPLKTAGRLELKVRYYGKTITTPVVVCPDVEGIPISWFACVELDILPQDYPRPIRPTVFHVD